MKTYPTNKNTDSNTSKKPGVYIFGNRFYRGQSLYEYLIEFLLIFSSAKPMTSDSDNAFETNEGKMKFHDVDKAEDLYYWAEPRMGLKRFVFFEKSDKSKRIKADDEAYDAIVSMVKDKMPDLTADEKDEIINGIQDLIRGYAVVSKKRFWGAPAVLPICPELIFCEVMPNDKERKASVDFKNNPKSIDTLFKHDSRNFLGRGGELYYLHLLQGFSDPKQREELERLLNHMLINECRPISTACDFIQKSWEKQIGLTKNDTHKKISLSFIPETAYQSISRFSVNELINFLQSDLDPINRIDILAKGIMFQIMRMMNTAVAQYNGEESKPWIIDMRTNDGSTIKKLSHQSFTEVENSFLTALNKASEYIDFGNEKERIKAVIDARTDSFDVFKAKGKELLCIIPTKGPDTRFTLSEDIVKFLVLSLIPPREKMTLDQFLDELYKHYHIVIGPDQFKYDNNGDGWASEFEKNLDAFQFFLKNTGFLQELSDATSVVLNPYNKVED